MNGGKGEQQLSEPREEDGETDEAKKTAGLHRSGMGLPGMLVLFVESHLPLLCSKHHPYLMRPLQSPEKKMMGTLLSLLPPSAFPATQNLTPQ